MSGRQWIPRLMFVGVLAGAVGCGSDGQKPGGGDVLDGSATAGLLRAQSCGDLLTKIQDDAIAKVALAVELYKSQPRNFAIPRGVGGGVAVDDVAEESDGSSSPPQSADDGDGLSGGDVGGAPAEGSGGGGDSKSPTGASDTNTQVQGVDEADFVKVVKTGEQMFVLHGSALFKLKTWPAAESALEGKGLTIEGSPTEMFVNDAGQAVVFSSVWGYGNLDPRKGAIEAADYCGPGYCGGTSFTKITIADMSGDAPKTTRELYYEGYYVSSRRYVGTDQEVVRVVMQAATQYGNLYSPDIQWADAWGRAYDDDQIAEQLDQWRVRSETAIRDTKLEDWLPVVQEAVADKLVNVDPACESYYVPKPGLSQHGLTHVLSLDVSKPDAKVAGVTILGATSTVYSNAQKLVLAQPDYRAFQTDFGFIDQQQTALHQFAISGDDTSYEASGFIPGHLPAMPQFALDEKDGVIRAATTGWERVNKGAKPHSESWWQTRPVNRVVTAKASGQELKIVGDLPGLGEENETIQSTRFVGDRAYLVTFFQTDPLIVVDVSKPEAPKVLGELKIPGFSQYMHPLDEDHLVTIGQDGNWGQQLQIFDVSDPTNPKQAHVLDLGDGTNSEAAYQHKAFTYYAAKKLLALPLYSYDGPNGFSSKLLVAKVDAKAGFDELGRIDHTSLLQQQQCGMCDGYGGCWEQPCASYAPDVRRGHFVSDDKAQATYVYSFSYGGVLVHDVSDLTGPVATVELPAPQWSNASWYGSAGGGVDGADGTGAEPGVDVGMPEPAPGEDAGTSEVDGGAAVEG